MLNYETSYDGGPDDEQDPKAYIDALLASSDSKAPLSAPPPSLAIAPPPPNPAASPVMPMVAPSLAPTTGQLISRAFAGLGDAVTSAYGKGKTNFGDQADQAIDQGHKSALIAQKFAEDKRKQGDADAIALRGKDPTSPESLAAQEQARSLGLFKDKDISKMTFAQLSPLLGTQESITKLAQDKEKFTGEQKMKEREFGIRNSELAATRDFNQSYKTANQEEKKKKFDTEDLEKLGKTVTGTAGVVDNLGEVERKLGFSLNDVDPKALKDGVISVGGKEKDIPGVNVPGLGWVSVASQEGRNLKGAMDNLFNTDLHDKFGARITDAEISRLKAGYQQGKYNTKADMMQALVDYKQALGRNLARQEASFRPELVQKYKDQGGITSASLTGGKPAPKVADAPPPLPPPSNDIPAPDGKRVVKQNGLVFNWNGKTGKYDQGTTVGQVER